jgi:hypothetical protein
MSGTYASAIDLSSVARCWPLGHEVPDLVRDLAALIALWPHGAVGSFSMRGDRFDDYWIESGGDLSEQFATLLSLADGTRVALWFHEHAARGAEPVVEIGSDGELRVLSATLKDFLLKWAHGPADRLPHDLRLSGGEATGEAVALRSKCAARLIALAERAPDHPRGQPAGASVTDLPKFMERWQEAATERMAADPVLRAVSKLLDAHIPRGKEPWERVHMHLRAAGPRVEIQTGAVPPDYTTFVPLPEREALVPLILEAREARARSFPGRGLWHSASLELYPDGRACIKASWASEPEFRSGGRMTRRELEADLARFPRSAGYREPWMDELM